MFHVFLAESLAGVRAEVGDGLGGIQRWVEDSDSGMILFRGTVGFCVGYGA